MTNTKQSGSAQTNTVLEWVSLLHSVAALSWEFSPNQQKCDTVDWNPPKFSNEKLLKVSSDKINKDKAQAAAVQTGCV